MCPHVCPAQFQLAPDATSLPPLPYHFTSCQTRARLAAAEGAHLLPRLQLQLDTLIQAEEHTREVRWADPLPAASPLPAVGRAAAYMTPPCSTLLNVLL